jgi:hypothetical protein
MLVMAAFCAARLLRQAVDTTLYRMVADRACVIG